MRPFALLKMQLMQLRSHAPGKQVTRLTLAGHSHEEAPTCKVKSRACE